MDPVNDYLYDEIRNRLSSIPTVKGKRKSAKDETLGAKIHWKKAIYICILILDKNGKMKRVWRKWTPAVEKTFYSNFPMIYSSYKEHGIF